MGSKCKSRKVLALSCAFMLAYPSCSVLSCDPRGTICRDLQAYRHEAVVGRHTRSLPRMRPEGNIAKGARVGHFVVGPLCVWMGGSVVR
jgi:hypothetical protein